MLDLVPETVDEKFACVGKQSLILNENVGKSQNTHVLVKVLGWLKSKARDRVWIVHSDVHIAKTLAKGTRS